MTKSPGSDLWRLGAWTLSKAYRAGRLSPVDVVDALLDRIARVDPLVNAFVMVDHSGARAAALASAERYRAGEPLSALDGVPVSVKDLLLTAGLPTVRGSRTTSAEGPWTDDAPSVGRLKTAGAVILGKTTTTEFGASPFSFSPLTGETRNPWNLGHGVGGSSSGAAAGLAAGLGPLALGTDAAGSIRMPAAFAGIVGLKPTYGRVAQWPPSATGDLAHTGPMARSVADCALLHDVISGPDPRDWESLPKDADVARRLRKPLTGKRIAVTTRLAGVSARADVAAVTRRAADAFARLGAVVEEAEPDLPDLFAVYDDLRFGLRAAGFGRMGLSAEQEAMMDPFVAGLKRHAQGVDLQRFMAAHTARARLAAGLRAFHARFDILLTPTVGRGAHPIGFRANPAEPWYRQGGEIWAPFTFVFNMTHQPALSMNAGFDADGLPVGVQLVGDTHDDLGVLQAAAALESEIPQPEPRDVSHV